MTIADRFTQWAPRILGATRILAGFMMACHGAQKVLGAFGGIPPGAPAWIVWTAGPLELFGGALLALGLLSRSIAFILSGLTAVAYFYGHARGGLLPKVNGGELAVLYCWLYLYLAAQGPGAWALDRVLFQRRNVAVVAAGA